MRKPKLPQCNIKFQKTFNHLLQTKHINPIQQDDIAIVSLSLPHIVKPTIQEEYFQTQNNKQNNKIEVVHQLQKKNDEFQLKKQKINHQNLNSVQDIGLYSTIKRSNLIQKVQIDVINATEMISDQKNENKVKRKQNSELDDHQKNKLKRKEQMKLKQVKSQRIINISENQKCKYQNQLSTKNGTASQQTINYGLGNKQNINFDIISERSNKKQSIVKSDQSTKSKKKYVQRIKQRLDVINMNDIEKNKNNMKLEVDRLDIKKIDVTQENKQKVSQEKTRQQQRNDIKKKKRNIIQKKKVRPYYAKSDDDNDEDINNDEDIKQTERHLYNGNMIQNLKPSLKHIQQNKKGKIKKRVSFEVPQQQQQQSYEEQNCFWRLMGKLCCL